MMQGDSFHLGIRIKNNAGNPVTPTDIEDVEISIGHISKTYRRGELTFIDGMWMFPMTQYETFEFYPSSVKAQVRIKWANGVIEGKPIYGIRIHEGISREVL